ncbi:MAG: NUDIX-like domain-containing protein, partial [Thermodesulfobacteriota bacterium]
MDKNKTFISSIVPPTEQLEPAWWFAFREDKLLVHVKRSSVTIPCLVDFAELGLMSMRHHYLGRLAGRHCYAVELAERTVPPAGMSFQGLRQIYGCVDDHLFCLAGRAVQIVHWDKTN